MKSILSPSLKTHQTILKKVLGELEEQYKLNQLGPSIFNKLIPDKKHDIIDESIIHEIIHEINNSFDPEFVNNNPCIQSAMIPKNLKQQFIDKFNIQINQTIIKMPDFGEGITSFNIYKRISSEDFQKNEERLYNDYKTWLKTTFFPSSNKFIRFGTEIVLRTQEFSDGMYDSINGYHREFASEEEINNDFNLRRNGVTSDSHLILYYPILENCRSHCGTRIKYNDKHGETHELILPADDNIVYCIRDCCFAHSGPISIPISYGENINRVLVRSMVTPEGHAYEDSQCPTFVKYGKPNSKNWRNMSANQKGVGGKTRKHKHKYKYRKHRTLRNCSKKNQGWSNVHKYKN